MTVNTTWRPRDTHGKLSEAKELSLPDSAFAFPKQRKGPLTGAAYVREAISGFRDFEGVTDEERDLAFRNIRKAAQHYNVEMSETDWRQLGTRTAKPDYRRSGS